MGSIGALTFSLLGLAGASTVLAATFYVDKSIGSDGYTATQAQSQSTPWSTISKCVAAAVNPGDTCVVKNGTYRESPYISASGTAANPITFKNFPGHFPKIDCGTMLVNCVNINSNGNATRTISYVVFQGFEITGGTYSGLKYMAADHLLIKGNYIHNTGFGDANGSGGNGILGACYSCTIDGNRIASNGVNGRGHGLYITGHGYTVINNIIYNNQNFGIQAASYDYNYNPSGYPTANHAGWSGHISNNTIAYNGSSGIVLWDAGNGGGGSKPEAMKPIFVENNILHENCTKSGCGHSGMTLYCGDIGAQIRNNVYFSTRFGAAGFFYKYASCTHNADILTVNSRSTNPSLVNAPATLPASPDFHLTSASIANNFGLNLYSLGVTADFAGNPRPPSGAFDAGAYESASGAQVANAAPAKIRGLKWR